MAVKLSYVIEFVRDMDRVEIGFEVPDLERFYEDMRAKGVRFSTPPKQQDFGGVLAQFEDYEGGYVSVGGQA